MIKKVMEGGVGGGEAREREEKNAVSVQRKRGRGLERE